MAQKLKNGKAVKTITSYRSNPMRITFRTLFFMWQFCFDSATFFPSKRLPSLCCAVVVGKFQFSNYIVRPASCFLRLPVLFLLWRHKLDGILLPAETNLSDFRLKSNVTFEYHLDKCWPSATCHYQRPSKWSIK